MNAILKYKIEQEDKQNAKDLFDRFLLAIERANYPFDIFFKEYGNLFGFCCGRYRYGLCLYNGSILESQEDSFIHIDNVLSGVTGLDSLFGFYLFPSDAFYIEIANLICDKSLHLIDYEKILIEAKRIFESMCSNNQVAVDSRKKNDLSQPQICALIWYLSKYENKYQITDISGIGTVLDAITQIFKDFGFTGKPGSAETKFAAIRLNLDTESYENISRFSKYSELIPYLNDYPKAKTALLESLSNLTKN